METPVMKAARVDARLMLKEMDRLAISQGGCRFRDLRGHQAMQVLQTILADTVDAEHDGEFVGPTLLAREAINQWCKQTARIMREPQSERPETDVPF